MTQTEIITLAKKILTEHPGIHKRELCYAIYGKKSDPDHLLMKLDNNGVLTCEDDDGNVSLFEIAY
jgi:hypothetical protein